MCGRGWTSTSCRREDVEAEARGIRAPRAGRRAGEADPGAHRRRGNPARPASRDGRARRGDQGQEGGCLMPVHAGDLELVASVRDERQPAAPGHPERGERDQPGPRFGTAHGVRQSVLGCHESKGSRSSRSPQRRGCQTRKIVSSAQEATKGLLTEHDIRLNANKALSLGVVQNEEDFASLAEAAIILGQKLGVGRPTGGRRPDHRHRPPVRRDPGQPRDHAPGLRGL